MPHEVAIQLKSAVAAEKMSQLELVDRVRVILSTKSSVGGPSAAARIGHAQKVGNGRNVNCFVCGCNGHMAKQCPNSGRSSGGGVLCFGCGERGHIRKFCSKQEMTASGNDWTGASSAPDVPRQ